MQRTRDIDSNARGRRNSLWYNETELNFDNILIAPSGTHESEIVVVEGFTHFHLYISRAINRNCEIFITPYIPFEGAGAPVAATGFPFSLATWTTGATEGIFYFGEHNILTSSGAVSMAFAPLISITLENVTVNSENYTVRLYCSD